MIHIKNTVNAKVDIASSGLTFLELGPPKVNKATALTKLTMRLNIRAEDTWAFGDEQNDIEMLKWAGCSYAMENAESSVKDAADFIAPSNDEDGVAATLENLFN